MCSLQYTTKIIIMATLLVDDRWSKTNTKQDKMWTKESNDINKWNMAVAKICFTPGEIF